MVTSRISILAVLVCVAGTYCGSALAAAPAPKDPPVAMGGEGATGNDWADFNAQNAGVLFWDNAGTPAIANTLSLRIATTNPNFVLANNRTGGGVKVAHVCYREDYARPGGPTVAQGNTDWHRYYAGYAPAITHVAGTNCTCVTNCVCYVYNAYVTNAVSRNWTNSGADANAMCTEPAVQVAASGMNGAVATRAEDRCFNNDHVWKIIANPGGAAPCLAHEWKNNSSPIYKWVPAPYKNDGARGAVANSCFTTYEIRRN